MVEQNSTAQLENDEISLKELILKINDWYHFLFIKWKLIILAGAIGGIIGFTYVYNQKISYKALLTFVLEEDKESTGVNGLAGQFGLNVGADGGGGVFSSSNLLELMKSRLIVEKTLLNPIDIENKRISLIEYYLQLNKKRETWAKDSVLKNVKFLPNSDRTKSTRIQDSIMEVVYTSLVNPSSLIITQKDKKSTIISIEVFNESELFAKLLCENLVQVTTEYYINIKSKKAKQNVEILQVQVDSIRNKYNTSINDVAKATDNIFNLNQALKNKATLPAKKQVDIQINTTMLSNLVTNLEMSKMALLKETPLIQIIDYPILPLVKQKNSKLLAAIFGSFIASILTIIYFILVQSYKKILK